MSILYYPETYVNVRWGLLLLEITKILQIIGSSYLTAIHLVHRKAAFSIHGSLLLGLLATLERRHV